MLRKLEQQQEIVSLLAKHSTMIIALYKQINIKMIDLNTKIARLKFKKLGEIN
jgi:hypothetical protein